MNIQLSKLERDSIRKKIFLHLDGWVLIPTICVLKKLQIIDLFLTKNTWSLEELNKKVKTNEGYLNVALRILASQGFINRTVNNSTEVIKLELLPEGREAFLLIDDYQLFYDLQKNFHVRPRNIVSGINNMSELKEAWEHLKIFNSQSNNSITKRMYVHMEGVLLGPTMVALGLNNKLNSLSIDQKLTAELLAIPHDVFKWFLEILNTCNFITYTKEGPKLNATGLYYTKRASAYGVTVSYLPTFANLETIFTGDVNKFRENDSEGHEKHVYRYMNVWGSGGAHKTYFKKVDEIIVELFNKPIEEQPKGIIDVGCGDGTFIEHVFDVIYNKTKRGELLEKHPLFIIGVDYNKKARIATRRTLAEADIWAEVEFGDISDPKSLAEMLQTKHQIDLGELLNTRTFLDHNRIYTKPDKTILHSNSDGAFAYRGRRIPNNELFQNLSNHLKSWTPYLKKYGLLIVELHSIPTGIASKNIGTSLSTPYDATHGYTDQYIIELECFLNAAKHAGLQPITKYTSNFPDREKATVSIHLLKAN